MAYIEPFADFDKVVDLFGDLHLLYIFFQVYGDIENILSLMLNKKFL